MCGKGLGLNFLRCLARQGNNEPLAGRIKSLWDEYEKGSTHVSKVVHQVDKLEALQQAYLYTIRYPTHDLSDFKSHRGQIIDPWLARQADEILRRWDALDSIYLLTSLTEAIVRRHLLWSLWERVCI
jgi:5'-deoxynucleotidase YfbR-like HD superfamily hydrolase